MLTSIVELKYSSISFITGWFSKSVHASCNDELVLIITNSASKRQAL